MGTVAVISEAPILLHELHVNLWILPGLGRQVRFLDVGFRFEVQHGEFKTFDLAIPGSGKRKPADLSQKITSESGSLIFGVPINRDTEGKISPAKPLDPDYISATLAELSEFTSMKTEAGASLWQCHLARPWSPQDGCGYCRARFYVPDAGRMWTHPGMSPLDGRSLFDIRILDVRDNATTAITVNIRNGGTPVQGAVNAHLIVPEEFEILSTAENHKYVRLLEAEAWRPYLGRKASLPMTRPKMLAVSWEKRGNGNYSAADVTRPARFACMLRKHTMTLALGRLLAAIGVAALATWFFIGADVFREGAHIDVIGWLHDMLPLKVRNVPGVGGTVEDLVELVASVPVLGTAAGVLLLWRWSTARHLLGRMRSSIERWLVQAEPHGEY